MARNGRRQSMFQREWMLPILDEERGYTVHATSSIAGEPVDDEELSVKHPVKNTYQLAPFLRFDSHAAKRMLKTTLERRLHDLTYNASKCAHLVKSLSDEIKEKAKTMTADRYRYVALVRIGQMNNQGYVSISRGLWDASCDDRVFVSFSNESLFAEVALFAVYKE